MTKTQLNSLCKKYLGKVHQVSKRYANETNIPVEEFISHLSNELWHCIRNFDPHKGASMDTWVNMILRRKAIDLIRGADGNYYKVVTLETEPAGCHNTEDYRIGFLEKIQDPRDFVDEFFRKNERDQRQLISFLTDPSKVDAETTAIVSNFHRHKSITALGKALGLHHQTVKRKLRKLSRNYDPNIFGNYRDYLAV